MPFALSCCARLARCARLLAQHALSHLKGVRSGGGRRRQGALNCEALAVCCIIKLCLLTLSLLACLSTFPLILCTSASMSELSNHLRPHQHGLVAQLSPPHCQAWQEQCATRCFGSPPLTELFLETACSAEDSNGDGAAGGFRPLKRLRILGFLLQQGRNSQTFAVLLVQARTGHAWSWTRHRGCMVASRSCA